MDITTLRIVATLASLRHLHRHRRPGPMPARNRARFDEAARIPFEQD